MLDRIRIVLVLFLSVLAGAQPPALDEGRLDPAWFGAAVAFQPAKGFAYLWLKPGFAIQGRTVHVVDWEPPAWLGKKRGSKDRTFLRRMEGTVEKLLEDGLRKGLGGQARVSRKEGDLLLAGRSTDAVGEDDSGSFTGAVSITFDLRLSDAASGEVVGAFHHTISSLSEGSWTPFFLEWCEGLGRKLAEKPKSAPPAPAPKAVPGPIVPPAPKPSPAPAIPPAAKADFDLAGTLRHLDALRQDGILTEDEYAALRKKAEEKAKSGRN
jgi:hypothetical protein